MSGKLFRIANRLYERFYPVYYPLYAVWKAVSDRRERKLFRQLIKPGMTVIDVGANVGVYTKLFSTLVENRGQVHAFEPAPANFSRLQENIGSKSNVVLNQAAVGKENGSIRLFMSDELNVDHRVFDSGDGRQSIDVPVVSLDEYFSPGQRVDVIKIDVQGYELSVLEGARRILEENRDIRILMEFWPYGLIKASVAPAALIDMVRALGFEVRTTSHLTDASNEIAGLDPQRVDHYCNLLISRGI